MIHPRVVLSIGSDLFNDFTLTVWLLVLSLRKVLSLLGGAAAPGWQASGTAVDDPRQAMPEAEGETSSSL